MDQTFLELLREIQDFRKGNAIQYRLQDILLTGTLAIICNMDTYTEMEMFVKHERAYLEPFCDFSRGVPSHDTFGKVFSRLDADALSEKFSGWMSQLRLELAGIAELQEKTIAIDGKTIRRSGSKDQKASHVITAFASELELVLGQVKTDEKSNEITAIPELLKLFQIKGNIITIDAMGTQKEIAQTIIEREADYVLAVKGNQKHMYEDLVFHLDSEIKDKGKAAMKEQGHYAISRTKDHGRIEIRECYLSPHIDWYDWKDDWAGLKGSGVIISRRQEGDKPETQERHYFIYSLNAPSAADLLRIKREHWAIENKLHWMLDMAFAEDDCRARAKNAAAVFNILRKLALQMLKTQSPYKCGMKSKRKLCGLGVLSAMRVLGISDQIS